MSVISFGSAIGGITVCARKGEVTRIILGDPPNIKEVRGEPDDDAVCADARRQIEQYLGGEREEFELKLSRPDGEFARSVYAALKRVPYGETVSYAQLAELSQHPGAARAVGTAMKNNPQPLAVPCHRVVKSDGSSGEYSGGGAKVKKFLLDLEQKHR